MALPGFPPILDALTPCLDALLPRVGQGDGFFLQTVSVSDKLFLI